MGSARLETKLHLKARLQFSSTGECRVSFNSRTSRSNLARSGSISKILIYGQNRPIWKLLALDRNTWHHKTVCKLLALDRNTWDHITGFEDIIIKRKLTCNHIIIILACHQHGYPWPSLATPPYRSSPPAGPHGYTPYPHRAAVCRFELVALLSLGHVKLSIGVHHL